MRFYENPYGGPEFIFSGSKKNAIAKARKFFRTRMRNVAAGFYDEDGVFHPIRASYDYSARRAGEGSRKSRKSKKRGKRR